MNGVTVGMFPPARAASTRRWQEREIKLPPIAGGGELHFMFTPIFETFADGFEESAWELLGAWVDKVFSGTFDVPEAKSQTP